MRAWVVVPLLAVVLVVTAWVFRERMWTPSPTELALHRNAIASVRTEASLQVALVRTSNRLTVQAFVDGAKMAEEEINQAGGVTLFDGRLEFHRPLNIRVYDAPAPEGSTSERVIATTILARQIAADPNVVAVMGHSFDAAIAASVIYNAAGVIYFATRTTDPALTLHRDMPYVFRVCPSDNDIMYELVALIPNMMKENKVGKKKVNVLLLYPESKTPPALDNPRIQLEASAKRLIGDGLVEFKVKELEYDPDSVETVFQDNEKADLIRRTDRLNVVMIADQSVAATTLRERIEELWTSHSLGEREQAKLFQPKIFDLGDLVGHEDQQTDSLTTPAQLIEFEYERMVRLILKETKQNVVVLYERESSEAAEAVSGQSSTSESISSRSSYGKQLIAHLEEDVPLTTDSCDALCQLSVLNITLARSYEPRATDFSEIVAEVKKVPNNDYVYLVGFNRAALELLKQLRRAGVNEPVIGSPRLEEQLRSLHVQTQAIGSPGPEDDETPERLGKTYVATTFDAWSDEPEVKKFLSNYRKYLENLPIEEKNRHKEFPGTAVYGYVSVQLLKRAFEGARTASPRLAAQFARLFVEYNGPLGNVRFKGGRDLLNLPIGFQQLGFHDKEHFIGGSRTRNQHPSPETSTAPSLSRP